MTYPIPSNLTGLRGVMMYADSVTTGWFSTLFIFSTVIIIFILLKSKFYKTSDSFALSSLFGFMLGAMLWAADILPQNMMTLFLFLTILGALWAYLED